ncbi:MAG TPA: flagellar motor protein MotS [Virgibacillus sp.]|nr:flagellar motor protein MotS [Virgibacillus sp.]
MKRRRIKRNKRGGAPKWMVTYSDMITLILVFFILLFSMSQIDLAKFEAISESFNNKSILNYSSSAVPSKSPAEGKGHLEKIPNESDMAVLKNETEDKSEENQDESLDRLLHDVKTYLNDHDLNDAISANRTQRGVVLVLQERILFDAGEAAILDSGKSFLGEIGGLLSEMPNNVQVEGHTDNRPITSLLYPSNWELSGARAGSVTRYLIDQHHLEESRFTIVGYSDTKPVEPNTSMENMRKNRRVEIVILEDSQKHQEEEAS